MVLLFYTTYISVYLAVHEIFHAKVGKGGKLHWMGYVQIEPLLSQSVSNSVASLNKRVYITVLAYHISRPFHM